VASKPLYVATLPEIAPVEVDPNDEDTLRQLTRGLLLEDGHARNVVRRVLANLRCAAYNEQATRGLGESE